MKISPVVGAPTIPNPSATGLSPEKLAKLKAIAAGQEPEVTPTEDEEKKKKIQQLPSIKMQTQRSTDRDLQQINENVAETTESEPEIAISDTSVQAKEEPEAIQPLSPQFAALAKQRRALQLKEREIADKLKTLEGPTRAELEQRIKTQPLSVLQELGVTYDQLTNEILAAQGGINPEIQALKAEIKALKEGVDKTLSDKDAAAEKAVLSEMRRNVNQLASQGDEYELIRTTQSQADVIDLIHRTWKETGEVLDEAEAMRLVEEELEKDALKIARLKKVQGKLTPEAPLQQQPQAGKPQTKTLTNKDSARPAMSRRQRAMLAMQGQLPKG